MFAALLPYRQIDYSTELIPDQIRRQLTENVITGFSLYSPKSYSRPAQQLFPAMILYDVLRVIFQTQSSADFRFREYDLHLQPYHEPSQIHHFSGK